MSMRWFKMINLFIVLQVFFETFLWHISFFCSEEACQTDSHVFNLRWHAFRLTTYICTDRRTMTRVKFGRSQIRTQVDAHFSLFGHSTQVDTSWLQVNCICVKFTAFCDLCELANRSVCPPSASPYTRSGFANLHRFSWLVILVWSVLLALVNASNHILTVS